MLKYFTKFDTQAEYDEAKYELDYPNVSIVASALTYTQTKPIQPQYRTVTTATTCEGYDLYTLEEYQVSYDGGTTWTTTASSATTLIESDSQSCGYVPPTPTFNGKWLATYTGGTTSSAECDSSSAITQNEITLTDLVSVEIGDCVTEIDDSAFYFCRSLTDITIPDSVTSIGVGVFSNCQSITNITIPSGVTSIEAETFFFCTHLESVTVLATTPPTLGMDVFFNTNDCPIYVPNESVQAYKSAEGWNEYSDRIHCIDCVELDDEEDEFGGAE